MYKDPVQVPGFRSWRELRAVARTDALVPDPGDALCLVVLYGRAPTLPERVEFARSQRAHTTGKRPPSMFGVLANKALVDALWTIAETWIAIGQGLPESARQTTLATMLGEAAVGVRAAQAERDVLIALHHARAAHARARRALDLALAPSAKQE